MNAEIKLALVQTALEKMYKPGGFFSISAIKEICEMCGIDLPAETESAMRLLHCIHFKDMDPKIRAWLAETIDGLFKDPDNLAANWAPSIMRSRIALSGNALFRLEEKGAE